MRSKIVRKEDGTIKPYEFGIGWEAQGGTILEPYVIEAQLYENYGTRYKPKGGATVMLFATDTETMYHNKEMVDLLQKHLYTDAGGEAHETGEKVENYAHNLYDLRARCRAHDSETPRLEIYFEPHHVAFIPDDDQDLSQGPKGRFQSFYFRLDGELVLTER